MTACTCSEIHDRHRERRPDLLHDDSCSVRCPTEPTDTYRAAKAGLRGEQTHE